MTLLGLNAQECSSLWITCPEAYIGQQVIYTHTYTETEDLSSAFVVIATTGSLRLFVNDNLVSVPSYPLARAPYRDGVEKTEPISCQFDISRYIKNDSNTITILSCPTVLDETPALSLRFYGTTKTRRHIVREADSSWICCPLNAYMTDLSSEYDEAAETNIDSDELFSEGLMYWLPVEEIEDNLLEDTKSTSFPCYEYIDKVIKPRYFSIDWDEKGVSYDFGNGYYGLLRVTLRDTRKGQHIYIAGSDYVCQGKDDEQFVLRFAASWFRKVYITGDKSFRTRNVSRVEGLEIVPKYANNFSF